MFLHITVEVTSHSFTVTPRRALQTQHLTGSCKLQHITFQPPSPRTRGNQGLRRSPSAGKRPWLARLLWSLSRASIKLNETNVFKIAYLFSY
jgi:hypothetical protein